MLVVGIMMLYIMYKSSSAKISSMLDSRDWYKGCFWSAYTMLTAIVDLLSFPYVPVMALSG